MKTIDVLDDNTVLLALTDAVRQTGEAITLMRDGRPVADVVPRNDVAVAAQQSKKELFDEIAALRKTLPPTSIEEILADINAGRRS